MGNAYRKNGNGLPGLTGRHVDGEDVFFVVLVFMLMVNLKHHPWLRYTGRLL
jgi:hypothetical protein